MLRYSRCYVLHVLYCPFLHHVAKPPEGRNPHAFACGTKCVEAAIQAVQTADVLASRGALDAAYCLTVDVLAMAALTLLVVELGAPTYIAADAVANASRTAKTLFESLAEKSSTAAGCLESLMVSLILKCHAGPDAKYSLQPLYDNVTRHAPPASEPADQWMSDLSLFNTGASAVPIFNSQFNSNMLFGGTQPDQSQAMDYQIFWPDLTWDDYGLNLGSNIESNTGSNVGSNTGSTIGSNIWA